MVLEAVYAMCSSDVMCHMNGSQERGQQEPNDAKEDEFPGTYAEMV